MQLFIPLGTSRKQIGPWCILEPATNVASECLSMRISWPWFRGAWLFHWDVSSRRFCKRVAWPTPSRCGCGQKPFWWAPIRTEWVAPARHGHRSIRHVPKSGPGRDRCCPLRRPLLLGGSMLSFFSRVCWRDCKVNPAGQDTCGMIYPLVTTCGFVPRMTAQGLMVGVTENSDSCERCWMAFL